MSEKRIKFLFYKEYINKTLSKKIKPIITEKAIFTNISNNYYTFIFPIYFNKNEISKYLQRVYRIKITKLHTNIYYKKKSNKRILKKTFSGKNIKFKKAFFKVKDFKVKDF
ncbi:50S ribosomal protein L23 [Candidatus Karelsulcia muelleri]|uniref:50S ribosomal protein L23 n=1 Tax=Candidatus Karelsulcia muelleri TaxID=336810 RepID=UPI001FF34520|nr:50S ribosomal protein L23 [Candidatus Karelsulcia muelleri]UOQ32998.1 50S ribosomal protein L23 [Candidatus Karelsulcia muelleri]